MTSLDDSTYIDRIPFTVNIKLTAVLEHHPDTIIGKVLEINGLITEGKTRTEVLRSLREGVKGYLMAFKTLR